MATPPRPLYMLFWAFFFPIFEQRVRQAWPFPFKHSASGLGKAISGLKRTNGEFGFETAKMHRQKLRKTSQDTTCLSTRMGLKLAKHFGLAPLQKCVGDFCHIISERFSQGIFLGTFSHIAKKSNDKIHKTSGGKKQKSVQDPFCQRATLKNHKYEWFNFQRPPQIPLQHPSHTEGFFPPIGADFREGDSNFSLFSVCQFTEWPGPLHRIAFPVEIFTKPLIH